VQWRSFQIETLHEGPPLNSSEYGYLEGIAYQSNSMSHSERAPGKPSRFRIRN
jgi:hypothetical protein